mgnify:CR=1 FL=1
MLRTQLNDGLKEAIKAKKEVEVRTLRLIIAALKDRDIAARSAGNFDGITNEEILVMLQSMIKQRQDSIGMYRQGNREDLAANEAAEIAVISEFLPQQLNEEEIEAIVTQLVNEMEATSIKDMGKIMGSLKAKHSGKMDFGKASQVVKRLLS